VRRGWLVLALILSLGVNFGLVGAALLRHHGGGRFGGGEGFERGDFRERMRERMGAEPREPRHDPLRDPGVRLADRFHLEGDVRERFLARQRELAEKVRELRPRIAGLERELREEIVAKNPDRARIEAIPAELAAATSELERAFAGSVLATRELLSGDAEREYLRFVEHFPGARRGRFDDDREDHTPRH
jgi:hypothetical protein